MSDFLPTANIATLKTRATLLRRVRQFFDELGFTEVQTPLLSADTVVDRHLDPVPVELSGRPMWLQTSPEFAMKRLLSAGMTAIYEITPAFRVGESGSQHNPEFTMLEWYRCGDSYEDGMQLLADLVSHVLDVPTAKRVTMASAFEIHAGFDPSERSAAQLQTACDENSVAYPASMAPDDWDTWFDLLFTALVQPHLGTDGPVIVHDYPASQSALARIRRGTPDVAERFELFIDGVELANGYHELLDAEELLQRNEKINEQRRADGKSELPEEGRLLEAMRAGLPPCVGVALGFDRLVMLAVGADSIQDVLTFPVDRA